MELVPERGSEGGTDGSMINDAYSMRLAQQLALISGLVGITARAETAEHAVVGPEQCEDLYARLRGLIAAQQGNSANALVRLSAISTCPGTCHHSVYPPRQTNRSRRRRS